MSERINSFTYARISNWVSPQNCAETELVAHTVAKVPLLRCVTVAHFVANVSFYLYVVLFLCAYFLFF